MTVMPSSIDVADKAVSTDDVYGIGEDEGGGGTEVAGLEAVLAILVETKVEAMKVSSTLNKKSGSAPASPHRRRLTSTSTASSTQQNYHHHHHHHHHRQLYSHEHNGRKSHQPHYHHHHHNHHHRLRHHRHGRHDSAPCGDFTDEPISHRQQKLLHGKGVRRSSEDSRGLKKKRKYLKNPQIVDDVSRNIPVGLDSRFELLAIDGDQDLSLINFERTREVLSDSIEYPRLHPSACYVSDSAAQLKIHYDDDDYVALNVADEFDEDDIFDGPKKLKEAPARYHRPRKKRKRRRRRQRIDSEVADEELTDPEELPPRARWTIIATACLLLAMSLLLVGVTLRMAPIIDDMGDGRRASVCKKSKTRGGSSTRRKDSVKPARNELKAAQKAIQDAREIEQARRHKRIAMIVLGTFLFLLTASVLVVVVTLTNSSFLSPATGSKELTRHRAQLRKENEELLNSLNRDISLPGNSTAPP